MLHVASCCLHVACDMFHAATVLFVRTASTMLWHREQEDSHYIEDTGATADDMAAQVAAYQVGSPSHICTWTGLTPSTSAPGLGSPLCAPPCMGKLLAEQVRRSPGVSCSN